MKTPHIHAAVIKAWADGESIQYKTGPLRTWIDIPSNLGWPMWAEEWEYRVKPEPKPDIVVYYNASLIKGETKVYMCPQYYSGHSNIKVVFDGETRELKSVELIK